MTIYLPMSETMDRLRGEWLSLVEELDRRIKGVDGWLEPRAARDGRVERLRTHPGLARNIGRSAWGL